MTYPSTALMKIDLQMNELCPWESLMKLSFSRARFQSMVVQIAVPPTFKGGVVLL